MNGAIALPAQRIQHYMRVTGQTGQWIMRQNYIALIHKIKTTEDCYILDFYKSRGDGAMLEWCESVWGPPIVGDSWWTVRYDTPALQIVVKGEDKVTLWQLTWGLT
jgi:hypothetical protein